MARVHYDYTDESCRHCKLCILHYQQDTILKGAIGTDSNSLASGVEAERLLEW